MRNYVKAFRIIFSVKERTYRTKKYLSFPLSSVIWRSNRSLRLLPRIAIQSRMCWKNGGAEAKFQYFACSICWIATAFRHLHFHALKSSISAWFGLSHAVFQNQFRWCPRWLVRIWGFNDICGSEVVMEPRVGNKYRLGKKIGSGSFGEIYLGSFAICFLLICGPIVDFECIAWLIVCRH